ncbi:MAG: hypothetical protein DMF63_18795 [Acidobacteria bacterium]|nr:MAG: hypothetical protein DMF63_18795 [Acidobacteriota bacterium]
MNENIEEVMLDLLCKKAVFGLNEQEEKQLAELQQNAGEDLSASFELTAARLAMADLDSSEAMPEHLRSRIVADAEKYFDKSQAAIRPVLDTAPKGSIFNWLGWAVATAACIALALNIYDNRQQSPLVQGRAPTPSPTPQKTMSPSQMRQQLILTSPDLARGTLGPADMPQLQPTGDVVWSDAKQTGYIRLAGLPKNDPDKETYQLWIVAENQNPKTPVDGGTFDVTSDGEVIIPIDAKVKVQNPQAFAITIEKPGGVVVSTQKHAALAKRES